MKQIGIFGGTFDPVHTGHLILAEQARVGAGLDQVIFVPAKSTPYKLDQKSADGIDRLEMIRRAIDGNAGFSVSDHELLGDTISYSIHTLDWFQTQYSRETTLHFILGTDAFLSIEKWKMAEELLRSYPLIVGARPKYKDNARNQLIKVLEKQYGTAVQKVLMPKIDISSSDIKNRVQHNQSIRYLVPESVEELIREKGLYQGDQGSFNKA